MLDVGWSEILVIAVVMIVIVGPKDLPKMLRAFGKATARMRTTANEFKRQFDDALKEAELDDVRNIIDETRKLDPRGKMTQVFDPIRVAGDDLKASLNQSPKSNQSAKPVDPVVYQDNVEGVQAKEEGMQSVVAEKKTPSDAIAEAVKKNLPDKASQVDEVAAAKSVKAKPAPKTKRTVRAATPATAKTSAEKVGAKPAKVTAAKATAVKGADAKPAYLKKTAAKKTSSPKNSVKKPAAKTTGTNE